MLDSSGKPDGEKVFEFFDDFEGNDLDPKKWMKDNHVNVSVGNSK